MNLHSLGSTSVFAPLGGPRPWPVAPLVDLVVADDAKLYKRAHVLGHAFGDTRDARSRLIRLPAAV